MTTKPNGVWVTAENKAAINLNDLVSVNIENDTIYFDLKDTRHISWNFDTKEDAEKAYSRVQKKLGAEFVLDDEKKVSKFRLDKLSNYDYHLDLHHRYTEMERSQSEDSDKYVMGLAIGGLLFSMIFLPSLHTYVGWLKVALTLSWVSFSLSLVSLLVSYTTGQEGLRSIIKSIWARYREDTKEETKIKLVADMYSNWTVRLNWTSFLFLFLGISLVIIAQIGVL